MMAPVVERRVCQEALGDVVRRGGPLEPEEQELRLERRRLLAETCDERAACGVGHVGREDEVRVGQRPDDRGLDPLVLGNRLGEARRIEPGDLPVVALTERGGVDLGLRDDLVDVRVVDRLEEIRRGPTRPLPPR